MTESAQKKIDKLYESLRESELSCIPAGTHDLASSIYPQVKEAYPDLCDDEYRCYQAHKSGEDQPEWKHVVRNVQKVLADEVESRIERVDERGKWRFKPKFEMGNEYVRRKLHDEYGGQRQGGISTPKGRPFIFLFTGDSGEDYGYEDEFRDDGLFIYTGEGQEGDMEMVRGNKAIRDHQTERKQLHVFEKSEERGMVTYLGEYEYMDHTEETLPDVNGDSRLGFRFKLVPAGGLESEVTEAELTGLSLEEFYKQAERSASTQSSEKRDKSSGSSGRRYSRSEVVKQFALEAAEGVCQGCEKDAPFIDESGEPFLEVHHLHRRSDGGPDHPDNVIAVCPNCHRRAHHSEDREEFNSRLITKAETRNQQLRLDSDLTVNN